MGKGRDKRRRKAKKNETKTSHQLPVRVGSAPPGDPPSLGDPDATVYAPLRPKPTPRSGAMALPEPHDAGDTFAALSPIRISK
jgi:hypothetical protein